MKNTWRVERGMASSGKEKQILYKKVISPGWYHQPGLKGGSLVSVDNTKRD
jgi:hypothetical protein